MTEHILYSDKRPEGTSIRKKITFLKLSFFRLILSSGYPKMNFNDVFNSICCLWVLTLQNNSTSWFNLLDMMDETSEHIRAKRTWRQLYFLVFYFLINVVLFNVFIGQVISISLTYLQ